MDQAATCRASPRHLLPGSVLDLHDPQGAGRAKGLGIRSVPAVVIDGKLADCCTGRGKTRGASPDSGRPLT
jgi:hypothetical protein